MCTGIFNLKLSATVESVGYNSLEINASKKWMNGANDKFGKFDSIFFLLNLMMPNGKTHTHTHTQRDTFDY